MTPEEKAKELAGRFREYAKIGTTYDVTTRTENARSCALICVEEIMKFMENDDVKHECCSWANSPEIVYWYKVKESLFKL